MKWLSRAVVFGVLGLIGYAVLDVYRGGFFDLPPLEAHEFPLSYKNGFRAVLTVQGEIEPSLAGRPGWIKRISQFDPDRKYLGVPFDVPSWFSDYWSHCAVPTDAQRSYFEDTSSEDWRRSLRGARFEGLCVIDADGTIIDRGVVYSVPKD